MALNTKEAFASVFGPESSGATPEERARTSARLFVRSAAHLAFDKERATGRRLSAMEALDAFGWETLLQLVENPVALIRRGDNEPQKSIADRFKSLTLDPGQVASYWGIPASALDTALGSFKGWSTSLERLTQSLALNESLLSFEPGSGGDACLAVRLRELQGDVTKMPSTVVMGLAETAWVVEKQLKLADWLRVPRPDIDRTFVKNPDYGSYRNPAWKIGLSLAHSARDKMGIDRSQPIYSISTLVEQQLGIPIINLQLPGRFAGATVSNNGRRGIAVNLDCVHSSVWTRRMTIAHELGHLLWDPDEKLNRLAVDYDDGISYCSSTYGNDYAEMRANAFAVEFLAPQSAVKDIYVSHGQNEEAVSEVMDRFGISFTAATYQIWNAMDKSFPRETLHCLRGHQPSAEWEASEALSVDMFSPKSVPVSRRGRFSLYVLQAFEAGLISKDSFISFMGVGKDKFAETSTSIRNLFL